MVKLVLGSGQGNQGSLQSLSYDCDSIALDTRANWKGMTRLFCVTHESTEKEQFAYLVGSSSFDTKIAQLHQDPYEIWPPFVTDQPTILAQCASDFECVFQVLPRTVLLLHPSSTGPKARVDLFIQENNPELNVCFAAIHIDGDMNLVYLCCSDGKNCSVYLLTMRLHPLEKDDFAILDLAMVKEYKGCSPSAFSLLQFRDHIQLLIGTYSKQVHTLVAGAGNWQPAHRSTRDVRCVPHSICLLGVAPDYILLASRDGKILGAFIEGTNYFKERFLPLFEPCKQPFTLTPMKKDGSVLASGEMLLYISFDTKLKHFIFSEVYTHGAQDHQDCVYIPRGVMVEEENGPSLHYESFCRAFYVAALTSDKMMIMKMQKEPSWTSRHVQLESTPTRLLVQKSCNRPLAIVALDADAQVGIGPQLQIIDQRDGETVHVCELEDGSSVKCLAEWRIKRDSKTFDYVCVGIGLANRLANAAVSGSSGDNANKYGCLRIYQLTSKSGAYDEPIFSLQKVWQHDSSEGAINAVFQHKNW
ncbi:hypothetical protein BC940DRAFT_102658 [Gongronella butleri]|nr:hypothetical protein BC940DRAFT_102658 [Gongronella butleri]